jgi:hypothetical protein
MGFIYIIPPHIYPHSALPLFHQAINDEVQSDVTFLVQEENIC